MRPRRIERGRGDPGAARRCYYESLELSSELGLGDLIIENFEGLGLVAHAQGDGVVAMRLLGAAAANRARLQLRPKPTREMQIEKVVSREQASARATADSEWRLGSALDTRSAVRYALEMAGALPSPQAEAVLLGR